jgi:hypothetical protein
MDVQYFVSFGIYLKFVDIFQIFVLSVVNEMSRIVIFYLILISTKHTRSKYLHLINEKRIFYIIYNFLLCTQ